MDAYLNFNGRIVRSDKAILTADNRGFRYGDGLFETLRISRGQVRLPGYHFERLFGGLVTMGFELPVFFTPANLERQILELCRKNGRPDQARVRLAVFRGNGGLYDPASHSPHYILQTMEIPAAGESLNENGLVTGVFPDGRKSCDIFANLKSNNFLVYAMAALYARNNRLNDSFVLNTHERLADSTISNIFYIQDGILCTPPLSEGCVAGVMRRFLLESGSAAGLRIHERETSIRDLETAQELFLTNAISGIRWVRAFGDTVYSNTRTLTIYNSLIKEL